MTSRFTPDEQEALYRKFSSSRQEKLRLMIALEEVASGAPLPKGALEAYRVYLQKRPRPAKELFLQTSREGIGEIARENSTDFWKQVRQTLANYFPYFSSAFAVLSPKGGSGEFAGCDGQYLYYPNIWEATERRPGGQALCRLYVHMVLHCFFGHMLRRGNRPAPLWNLACDVYVEYVLRKDFPTLFAPSLSEQLRRLALGEESPQGQQEEILRKLKQAVGIFNEETIYAYLTRHPKMGEQWYACDANTLESFCPPASRSLFSRDSHTFWEKYAYPKKESCRPAAELLKISDARERAAAIWSRLRQSGGLPQNSPGHRAGQRPGGETQEISLHPREKVYDYRRFLERFMISGEELQLDLESFDYIPYTYSRGHYEKLVFLEPLEYAQVHRLRELVIAIDTSGSCRGDIVRRFLEETCQILCRRENFFRHMRVHLLQCDSMLQEYLCIESIEQWWEASRTFQAKGLGGTDFRPVFSFVEKLRKEKKIQRLQGLLYFTDGDGIYPTKAPDYETAFVFLNQELEKGNIPAWAWRLNLQMPLAPDSQNIQETP